MKKLILIILISFSIQGFSQTKCYAAYDGDTVDCIIQLGLDVSITSRLRLLGYDAPEMKGIERPQGIIARDYIRNLILNKSVIINTNGSRDKYGRLLAIIIVDGININDLMIKQSWKTNK